MKNLLTALALLFAFQTTAQQFEIEPALYDSVAPDQYHFFFNGTAVIDSTMLITYSVKTTDSIPQLLFSDSVDFTQSTVMFPAGFSYNDPSNLLSVDLGTYATRYLILELISVSEGEIREHIYIDIHALQIYAEDED